MACAVGGASARFGMQWLSDFSFGDNRVVQIGVLAACGIAVLVGLALFYRLVFAHRLNVPGGRARQPRLGLVDAFSLDGQRQLVLVRRDNVEHLIMIGGPNDVLLETQINRAFAQPREAGLAAAAPTPRRRADPVAPPAAAPAPEPAPPPGAAASPAATPPVAAESRPIPIRSVAVRDAAPPAAQPQQLTAPAQTPATSPPPAPSPPPVSPQAPAAVQAPAAPEPAAAAPAAAPAPAPQPTAAVRPAPSAAPIPLRRSMPQPIAPLSRATIVRGPEKPAQAPQPSAAASQPAVQATQPVEPRATAAQQPQAVDHTVKVETSDKAGPAKPVEPVKPEPARQPPRAEGAPPAPKPAEGAAPAATAPRVRPASAWAVPSAASRRGGGGGSASGAGLAPGFGSATGAEDAAQIRYSRAGRPVAGRAGRRCPAGRQTPAEGRRRGEPAVKA